MYKTKALDVAAYLYAKGHDCSVKPLNDSYAEFQFQDKNTKQLASKFLKGDVVMNVAKYNSARVQLKHLSAKQLSYQRCKKSGKI